MRVRRMARVLLGSALAGGGAVSAVALLGAGAAGALPVPAPSTVWVSAPSAPTCGAPTYPTISAAVAAVAAGGQVDVCPGTYHEDVVVMQPVTIVGLGAVVDPGPATNSPLYGVLGSNAFTVMAPGVTVEGFTVEGASGDGILTIANDTTIIQNTALDNGFGPDGGTGIDLNGSSYSTVRGNTMEGNSGGGVYLTDDPGTPASYDTVVGNIAENNPGGCGFILADHTGAGIFDNEILGNTAVDNGNVPAGAGAGVVLASPVPGGAVYDNTVEANVLEDNGLAGVTLHSHLPGQGDFSGNVVMGNTIGVNNVGGTGSEANGDDGDPYTTGVYLGTIDPLTITVTGNIITGDKIGIYTAGPVGLSGTGSNVLAVPQPVVVSPTYAG